MFENTLDGSVPRGCLARGETETGRGHISWITFGAVKPGVDTSWDAVASRIDCGDGPFDKAGAQTVRTFGTPCLIVDVETIPTVHPAARIRLNTTVGLFYDHLVLDGMRPTNPVGRMHWRRRYGLLGAGHQIGG